MRHDDVRIENVYIERSNGWHVRNDEGVEKIGEYSQGEHDTKRMIENSSKYIVSSCVIFILLPLFGRVKKIETL
jgi:hypothetical protein